MGGKSISLGDARVACGAPGGGWTLEGNGHAVRPPTADTAIGHATDSKIAADAGGCASSKATLSLVVTAGWPVLDPASIVFAPDEARVELRGRRLKGMGIVWNTATGVAIDICQEPKLEPNAEHCSFAVGHGLSADPTGNTLAWLPAGGRAGADVTTFDFRRQASSSRDVRGGSHAHSGRGAPPFRLGDRPVHRGAAKWPCSTPRPSLRSTAERCAARSPAANCRSKDRPAFLARSTSNSGSLPTSSCNAAMGGCSADRPPRGSSLSDDHRFGSPAARHRFGENRRAAEGGVRASSRRCVFSSAMARPTCSRARSEMAPADVVLRLGNVEASALTITAVRADDPSVTVAVAHTETRASPVVRATLELPGYPHTNFIPTNRRILVDVPKLEGAPDWSSSPSTACTACIKRVPTYPFRETRWPRASRPCASDTASIPFRGASVSSTWRTLVDPLQRSIHEANLPAPIGPSALGPNPLVEFMCAEHGGRPVRVAQERRPPPLRDRDTCRLVFHRERLSLNTDAEAQSRHRSAQCRWDRARRGARFADGRLALGRRAAHRVDPRRESPFRPDHRAPLARRPTRRTTSTRSISRPGAPDIMWTAVLGTGHARLYATTAIPTRALPLRRRRAQRGPFAQLRRGFTSRPGSMPTVTRDSSGARRGNHGHRASQRQRSRRGVAHSNRRRGRCRGERSYRQPSSPTQAFINLHAWD